MFTRAYHTGVTRYFPRYMLSNPSRLLFSAALADEQSSSAVKTRKKAKIIFVLGGTSTSKMIIVKFNEFFY